jgi:hypothetical protein
MADNQTLAERLQQYAALKQAISNYVLEAEDEVASALETFSAEQLSRWAKPTLSGLNRSDLAVDMFLSEGQVANRSVIDRFLHSVPTEAGLSAGDRTWLQQWKTSFNGLFVVREVFADGYSLMNWLTEKTYRVFPSPLQAAETLERIAVGEIVLARLLPLTATDWVFSGPITLLGKLGEPKLAVAIGNFKQWFPEHLYGDAPELKEAAWESVKQHYDEFLAFFGAAKVTLSGYELNQKIQTYQAQASEKQLAAAGIDSSKSLGEIAQDAGISAEEILETVDAAGEEGKIAKKLLESKRSLKMVMPTVTLPDELRKAEAVTVLVHPRWGQMFFKDYSRLETLLDQSLDKSHESSLAADAKKAAEEQAALDRLVQKYLQDEQANLYVWQTLAQSHPQPLEAALQRVLNNPSFDISSDLEQALSQAGKSLTPKLPDSASVPVHLHNLFESALKAVGKSAAKNKSAKKKASAKKSGFGA